MKLLFLALQQADSLQAPNAARNGVASWLNAGRQMIGNVFGTTANASPPGSPRALREASRQMSSRARGGDSNNVLSVPRTASARPSTRNTPAKMEGLARAGKDSKKVARGGRKGSSSTGPQNAGVQKPTRGKKGVKVPTKVPERRKTRAQKFWEEAGLKEEELDAVEAPPQKQSKSKAANKGKGKNKKPDPVVESVVAMDLVEEDDEEESERATGDESEDIDNSSSLSGDPEEYMLDESYKKQKGVRQAIKGTVGSWKFSGKQAKKERTTDEFFEEDVDSEEEDGEYKPSEKVEQSGVATRRSKRAAAEKGNERIAQEIKVIQAGGDPNALRTHYEPAEDVRVPGDESESLGSDSELSGDEEEYMLPAAYKKQFGVRGAISDITSSWKLSGNNAPAIQDNGSSGSRGKGKRSRKDDEGSDNARPRSAARGPSSSDVAGGLATGGSRRPNTAQQRGRSEQQGARGNSARVASDNGCFRCGSEDHWVRDCPTTAGGSNSNSRPSSTPSDGNRKTSKLPALPVYDSSEFDLQTLDRKHAHPRDSAISFDAGPHKYYLNGKQFRKSVTGNVGNYHPEFKTDVIISQMMKGQNWPREEYMVPATDEEGFVIPDAVRPMNKEEIKQKWDFMRDDAANRGTYMHAIFEWLLQDPRTMEFTTEMRNFFDFYDRYVKDAEIEPYRLEWRIYHEELDLAGSVDFVGRRPNGKFVLMDWKRSKEVKRQGYNGKKMKWPFNQLPDSNLGHYAVQLNLYKMILEEKYGIEIDEMLIPFMHPDVNEVVPVEDLQLYVGPNIDPKTGVREILSRVAGPPPSPRNSPAMSPRTPRTPGGSKA